MKERNYSYNVKIRNLQSVFDHYFRLTELKINFLGNSNVKPEFVAKW